MPIGSQSPPAAQTPAPPSPSRPEWAKGAGPEIAGPSPAKRRGASVRRPMWPGGEAQGAGEEVARGDQKASAPASQTPAPRRVALAAAGIVLLAALAGLIGGRLGGGSGERSLSPSQAGVPAPAQPLPQQPIPSATLSQLYEKVAPSVVQVIPSAGGPDAAASGIVLDEEGTILTSNDVANRGEVTVRLPGGQEVPARVAGTDPDRNLAALRLAVPVPGLVAAELGNSDAVKVGDPVAAIGAPFGLDQTLTSGVVSALKRSYDRGGGQPLRELIQSDAPINRGAFGGPLVNEAGEVVGINIAIESPVDAFVGVGFAVPINQAKGDLLERIQEV